MKKFLLPAALFLVSFLAINAGMYFFLQATQPKMGKRVQPAVAVKADSTTGAKASEAKSPLMAEVKPESATPDTAAKPAPVTASMGEMPTQPTLPPPEVIPAADTATTENAPAEPKQAEAGTAVQEAAGMVQSAATDGAEMSKLSKLLESMKPDEAAAIASQLTVDQIVQLVMKMKDRQAGKMLAALPVDQAAQVATKMSKSATRVKGGL
jgi:cytoskeletal protein RodZ